MADITIYIQDLNTGDLVPTKYIDNGDGTFSEQVSGIGGVGGGVNHVNITAPANVFSLTGSPITTSGTIAFSYIAQNANKVFAGPTSGANLTNNVTSGGTDDTIANYTDLTVYANDAATIRNDIYQLARKLKQVNDALRLYGLLT